MQTLSTLELQSSMSGQYQRYAYLEAQTHRASITNNSHPRLKDTRPEGQIQSRTDWNSKLFYNSVKLVRNLYIGKVLGFESHLSCLGLLEKN